METIQDIKRFFDYELWANQETLIALRQSPDPPVRSLKILAHILAAQELWLVRLNGTAKPVVVWPDFTLDELEFHMKRIAKDWTEYLNSLNETKLSSTISYKNSKGEPWSSKVNDVLIHLIFHSNYHRGQVALDLRVAGLVPPYTDFIHAVRQGFIDSK
jgi:uncharacterized damage-inducible protein DinB